MNITCCFDLAQSCRPEELFASTLKKTVSPTKDYCHHTHAQSSPSLTMFASRGILSSYDFGVVPNGQYKDTTIS